MTSLFHRATLAAAAEAAVSAPATRPAFPLARVICRDIEVRLQDGTDARLTLDAQVHDPASAPPAQRVTCPQLSAWAFEAAAELQAADLQALADAIAEGCLGFEGVWRASVQASSGEATASGLRQAA